MYATFFLKGLCQFITGRQITNNGRFFLLSSLSSGLHHAGAEAGTVGTAGVPARCPSPHGRLYPGAGRRGRGDGGARCRGSSSGRAISQG